MAILKNRNIYIIFGLIFLAEILSFCGYLLPEFRQASFFIVIAAFFIVSLIDFKIGLLILLIELLIGSKGYLFYLEMGPILISARIAFWVIIMSIWFSKVILELVKYRSLKSLMNSSLFVFIKSKYWKYYLALFVFIAWGLVNGLLLKNNYSDVFLDFNGWLYFLLAFPIYYYIKSEKDLGLFVQSFIAAVSWLALKSFFLLFVFSHNLISMMTEIYKWVRNSGVGEITQIQGGFSRIFFQSHVYILMAFFILFAYLIKKINNKKVKEIFKEKINLRDLIALGLLLAVVLLGYSRSNWVGLIVGLVGFLYLIIRLYDLKYIFKTTGVLIVSGLIGLVLIAVIVKFPYPNPVGGFSTAGLLAQRAGQISGEAAVSSRWNLLPELWSQIVKAPISGKGFGANVTYKSNDPRVVQSTIDGIISTYAFEWGFLDIWLKLGLLGLLAYLLLLFKIVFDCLKNKNWLILVIGLNIIVLSAISFFSPYLNHPLGIGYLIVSSALAEKIARSGE